MKIAISPSVIKLQTAKSWQIPNRSKLYAGYSMPTPQGKHFNRLPMRCLPKVSPTVRMHLAGTKNMVSRILANADYCGTAEYPQIITAGQFEAAEQIRKSKTVTYSATLKPFRKDMHCGCCGARLYWHPKSNQWFCRECGMWSKPTQAEETFNSIVEKLRWLQQNPELIHPPAGKANVQSMEIVLLDREIEQALLDEEPDADALITKILHRAELEYEFCSAGDADPATMQIQKACAEYAPTEEFPETFYKEVVSKVILYRDTHIEFKLQNGQIV